MPYGHLVYDVMYFNTDIYHLDSVVLTSFQHSSLEWRMFVKKKRTSAFPTVSLGFDHITQEGDALRLLDSQSVSMTPRVRAWGGARPTCIRHAFSCGFLAIGTDDYTVTTQGSVRSVTTAASPDDLAVLRQAFGDACADSGVVFITTVAFLNNDKTRESLHGLLSKRAGLNEDISRVMRKGVDATRGKHEREDEPQAFALKFATLVSRDTVEEYGGMISVGLITGEFILSMGDENTSFISKAQADPHRHMVYSGFSCGVDRGGAVVIALPDSVRPKSGYVSYIWFNPDPIVDITGRPLTYFGVDGKLASGYGVFLLSSGDVNGSPKLVELLAFEASKFNNDSRDLITAKLVDMGIFDRALSQENRERIWGGRFLEKRASREAHLDGVKPDALAEAIAQAAIASNKLREELGKALNSKKKQPQ